MAITQTFLKGIDHPEWRPKAYAQTSTGSTTSVDASAWLLSDFRGRDYADPHVWANTGSTSIFKTYNTITDGWAPKSATYSFGTVPGGTAGTGQSYVLVPSAGPSGTIAAGATTTTLTLSTALGGTPRLNQLANRGDGQGYIIRIIGNAGGSSGKIEERRIVANTSSTTPLLTLDSALSFTPATGDRYEILSGRIYTITAGASKDFKYYELCLNGWSSSLSTTNLPGTIGATYHQFISMDEAHVPSTRFPGEGYLVGASTYDTSGSFTKGCLLATGSSGTSITGQAASGDAAVLTNQFRNFQIRIVEDTAIPTAVGQRRQITSHTAGPSPVYTVSAWAVTPSTNAKFVIENNTDWLLFWHNGTTSTHTYSISGNAWSTATFGARSNAHTSAGFEAHAFGLTPDAQNNVKNSFIYVNRTSQTYDVLDIAAAATGTWTNGLAFDAPAINSSAAITSYAYVPWIDSGRYLYLMYVTTSLGYCPVLRFDLLTNTVSGFANLKYSGGTTTNFGNKMASHMTYTQATPLSFLYANRPYSTYAEFFDCFIPNNYV